MAKRPRRAKFPHLDRRVRRLKSGQVAIHYFYRPLGLARGRLPPTDDPDFEMQYALKAKQFRNRNAPNPYARTLGELRTLLRSSAEWALISASQRKSYERAFEEIRKRWPDNTLLGAMDDRRMRPVIVEWFRSYESTPSTANMHKAGLSRLLALGVERGLLQHNHALGIRRIPVESRAAIVWTPEEVALAIARMPPELASAVALAYATAQRQSDLIGLTWNDVSDDGLTFRPAKQQKRSRQRLFIPMYDELEAALALAPRRCVTVLTTAAGQPWKLDNFRHSFKQACRQIDLPEALHFHDLRGSAIKAFADAGCSELEIRAISGHSMKGLPGALGSYVDAWRSLALSAVTKRENKNSSKVQTAKKSANGVAPNFV